jgi:tungstate transport system substrate-binding protein
MKAIWYHYNILCLLFAALLLSSCTTPTKENCAVRVGVIGGMMRSGLWPELARKFEAERGCRVDLVLSGNRDLLAEAVRAGKVDLVAMHAGETAANLVSDGYARNMRQWTCNEFVIIGPRSDPAGIRGLCDGAAALARIARVQAPFINYQNSGPREIAESLWKRAGIHPQGAWLLDDESDSSEEAIEFARKKQAYIVLGRVPTLRGNTMADLEILVQGDREMHRAFIVLEANPKKWPQTNVRDAHALAGFLLRPKTQDFLFRFATNSPAGMPLFYPVTRP